MSIIRFVRVIGDSAEARRVLGLLDDHPNIQASTMQGPAVDRWTVYLPNVEGSRAEGTEGVAQALDLFSHSWRDHLEVVAPAEDDVFYEVVAAGDATAIYEDEDEALTQAKDLSSRTEKTRVEVFSRTYSVNGGFSLLKGAFVDGKAIDITAE